MLAPTIGDTFHLGPAWMACWSQAYGGDRFRMVAGLPVLAARLRAGPLRLRALTAATNPHSLEYDVPAGIAADDALPARLFADSGAGAIRFDYLSADARLLAAAPRWRDRYRAEVHPHARCPAIDCRGRHADWFAARSKRLRHRLRRDMAHVFGPAGMTFEISHADPVASGVWAECLALEQAGWKGAEGTAILDSPADTAFYTALATAAAAAGALRLALLRHDGRIVAFELGLLGRRRLFLLKVAYAEEQAEHSLGYVIAARHIEACFAAADIDVYDKMGNGMTPAPYKLRFADECDTLYRMTLYAPDWRGSALRLHDRGRQAARRLRDRWRA